MSAANQMAATMVQELALMQQRLEMQQLEKIRAICEAAMEDMRSLGDKVRQMKPLLDQDFVAYLSYAIDVERENIRRNSMDPDQEPTQWLQA
ncbi:unnamed protein product, partial [Discosporangium mesarthrocarpum]